MPVDIDNQEKVFARLEATLELSLARSAMPKTGITFETIEDFHPDHLLKRLDPLANLLNAMTALRDPSTADAAAEQLRKLLAASNQPPASDEQLTPQPKEARKQPIENDEETLARLLGKASPERPHSPKEPESSPVDGLIRQAVESSGSVTSSPSSSADGLMEVAEMELSSRLRAVLHDPDFQALEAAWRSVDFLIRRCPDGERIRYFLMDVTLDELDADIDGLRRLLRDTPPQLILGNFTFGQTNTGLEALGKLAALCSELDARFFGGAHPLLAGCDGFDLHPDPDDWQQTLPLDVADAWATLRASPHSTCVGLALPRFLLRQPYGQGSDLIEAFKFNEITDVTDHESFLWGNSAFVCVQVLVEALVAQAEGTTSDEGGQIGELPVFRYKDEDGESAVKPCAEAWLADRGREAILRAGLIPCQAIKNSDGVRLPSLQSILSCARH